MKIGLSHLEREANVTVMVTLKEKQTDWHLALKGEMRNTHRILFENKKGRHHLKYLGGNGRKYDSGYYIRVVAGFRVD